MTDELRRAALRWARAWTGRQDPPLAAVHAAEHWAARWSGRHPNPISPSAHARLKQDTSREERWTCPI